MRLHPKADFPKAEETKRTARILETIQLISIFPRRYLRRDLSARFEISERMVQKDLEIIRHGLMLELKHDQQGYYFESIPSLPALRFSFGEALALLLSLQAAATTLGPSSPELMAARGRLEALFPSEFQPFLQNPTAETRVSHLYRHRQQILIELKHSLIRRLKVRLKYQTGSRGGAESDRVVHPYELMPYERSWQLIGYCELRAMVRMFKVDRIVALKVLEEPFSKPAEFNLAAYMGNTWGILRRTNEASCEIILQCSPECGRWITEVEWHSSQHIEYLEDGSVIVRFQAAPTPEMVNWIMSYSPGIRVLQPDHLARQVADQARKIFEIYFPGNSNDA